MSKGKYEIRLPAQLGGTRHPLTARGYLRACRDIYGSRTLKRVRLALLLPGSGRILRELQETGTVRGNAG